MQMCPSARTPLDPPTPLESRQTSGTTVTGVMALSGAAAASRNSPALRGSGRSTQHGTMFLKVTDDANGTLL